jgi:hypothetical protein
MIVNYHDGGRIIKGKSASDFWFGTSGCEFFILHSAIRHAPRRVHGCPEPYVVQGAFRNRPVLFVLHNLGIF